MKGWSLQSTSSSGPECWLLCSWVGLVQVPTALSPGVQSLCHIQKEASHSAPLHHQLSILPASHYLTLVAGKDVQCRSSYLFSTLWPSLHWRIPRGRVVEWGASEMEVEGSFHRGTWEWFSFLGVPLAPVDGSTSIYREPTVIWFSGLPERKDRQTNRHEVWRREDWWRYGVVRVEKWRWIWSYFTL